MTGPLLATLIFDVDGVLPASPHERAWREALAGLANPALFTTATYQAQIAGKPRLDGARAALEALSVPDAVQQAPAYAARKQARLLELIGTGAVAVFPDALRFVSTVKALGWPMAGACWMRSASTSAGATCGTASRTRSFSCSQQRGWAWRRPAASSSRTRPPACRRPVRAAWRR